MRRSRKDRSWHVNSQRSCGAHIDDEIKLAGLLYGHVGGLVTLQYLVDVDRCARVVVSVANAIRHQAAGIDVISDLESSRQSDIECSSRNESALPQRE